jgi:hypothetical protein
MGGQSFRKPSISDKTAIWKVSLWRINQNFFGSTFASGPAGWLRESGSRLHAVQVNPLPILMRSPSCAPDGSISASLRFPAFNRYYEDTKTASVRLSRLRIPLGVRYHACFFFLGDHWREARP